MKSKIDAILKLTACDAVVITVAQISAPAMAGSAADAIKERRALMKSNAGHMRAIDQIERGEAVEYEVIPL